MLPLVCDVTKLSRTGRENVTNFYTMAASWNFRDTILTKFYHMDAVSTRLNMSQCYHECELSIKIL